jgi:hypothetical protein
MIMRAVEASLPWDRMREILGDFERAIESFDCRHAVVLLREAVPEYRPTEEIRDHVWVSRTMGIGPVVADSKVTSLSAHRRNHEALAGGRPKQRESEGASPQPT